MKPTNIILFLFLLVSCNLKAGGRIREIPFSNSSESTRSENTQDTISLHSDTLKVNGLNFIQILKGNSFKCLLSQKGDTVIDFRDYYFKVEIIDINEDTFNDLRVFIFSNTPNECENYLFDKDLKTFRKIEGCDLDIKKIKGTDFYYSYNRAGCDDMNWESYLSKIEDFKLVSYGYINGLGCDNTKENSQLIEIYKIINSEKGRMVLLRKLPYLNNITKNNNKWDFIRNYWYHEYKKFE
jgi:hypothetical protein